MALKETIRKYNKEKAYVRRFSMKYNIHTDADIIAWLEKQESMQGYIKSVIRADIAAHNAHKSFEIVDIEGGKKVMKCEVYKSNASFEGIESTIYTLDEPSNEFQKVTIEIPVELICGKTGLGIPLVDLDGDVYPLDQVLLMKDNGPCLVWSDENMEKHYLPLKEC